MTAPSHKARKRTKLAAPGWGGKRTTGAANKNGKTLTAFKCPDDLRAELVALSKSEKTSVSAIIIEGLGYWLQNAFEEA